MTEDVLELISLLRLELVSCVDTINSSLDRISVGVETSNNKDEASNKILVSAIKDQIAIAVSESERFCNSASGQLEVAEMYAKSLI